MLEVSRLSTMATICSSQNVLCISRQARGTPTYLSPFAAGGKMCLTAAANSATVSSRVKITALGPASNVYATWNPKRVPSCSLSILSPGT